MSTPLVVVCDVALVFCVARLLRVGLDRLRQPPVMAEVLAGLVLGASVLGALGGDPAALFPADARTVLTHLGEVALVAYVFLVGADLDERGVRREGGPVLLVAAVAFAVPAAAGALLALGLHGTVDTDPPLVPFVVFLATALAVTAFPVLARIVDVRGLADRPAGRIALAAAAAQEALVWPALAVAVALGTDGGRSPLTVLALGALAVAGTLLLARVVVPALAGRGTGVVALAGLGVSAWATQAAGLHLILGAFVYGAALRPDVRRAGCALLRRRPLVAASALLLPLYFALPALRVDVTTLGAGGLGLLALVVVVAAAAKLGSAAGAARLAGVPPREALTVGVLMNARGLVELVVLTVGLSSGLLDERLYSVMVLMALITTFATGPLVDALSGPGHAPARPAARPSGRPRPRSTGSRARP